jgi:hypothetical protein
MNKDILVNIEKDESQLYDYIIDLAKSENYTENDKILKIEKYLNHSSPDIKSAVFFALLFVLKIDNGEYRDLAIKYLVDVKEDEDLRVKCSSGLAQTYSGTKNKELLSILYRIFSNTKEELYVKSSTFNSMLLVNGLNSREIFLRRKGHKQSFDDDDLKEFSSELDEIRSII